MRADVVAEKDEQEGLGEALKKCLLLTALMITQSQERREEAWTVIQSSSAIARCSSIPLVVS